MKVRAKEIEVKFKPVEITITLESESEVGAFYAMFNHSDLCDIQKKHGLDYDAIRSAITEKVRDVKYWEIHSELCKIIK